MNEPNNCSHCGSNDWGKYVIVDNMEEPCYYVYCWNCGYRTKAYPTQGEDVKAWNEGRVFKEHD